MLKLVVSICAVVALLLGYTFIVALQSGKWVDQVLLSLYQNWWSADVIARNFRRPYSPQEIVELQNALDDLRNARLTRITPTECTHGLHYESGQGTDFRSRCVASAVFQERTVMFDFELKGFWNEWQITGFSFGDAVPSE